jgi:cytochrome b subunit of formate dehydrogenase
VLSVQVDIRWMTVIRKDFDTRKAGIPDKTSFSKGNRVLTLLVLLVMSIWLLEVCGVRCDRRESKSARLVVIVSYFPICRTS